VNAVNIKSVPLTADFDIDEDKLLRSITDDVKLIFLCSPNNPTAALLSRAKVKRIIDEFSGIVIVDEAYIDFAGSESFIQDLAVSPNLVVLQTFSKAWGLAALRCGMAYGSEEIIRILNKIKYPYNINVQTQELVLQALDRVEQKDKWVREILAERRQLEIDLATIPVVERVYPSDSNFILAKVRNARDVYHFLMEKKIIVRDRSKVMLCENCLRITVGTRAENNRLITTLKTL
jgi:histidinol-phosphate aminotransferase